ncbi:MAG: DUF2244 domain-containing protein [Alphaproteobacteria bacterium]|nr:DUF2244 domain-containing protein [Alphaproteobacteria bacterium]
MSNPDYTVPEIKPEISADSAAGRTAGGLHFDAVLYPHRSLGPRGFMTVMTCLTVFSFVAGLSFYLIGAWPVLGFFGLDVLLIYVAFRINFRAGRVYETVQLDDASLLIRRFLPDGRILSWNLQAYWAQVEMIASTPSAPLLAVRSHGKYLVFGKFLTAEERHEFASALRQALARNRTHRYA